MINQYISDVIEVKYQDGNSLIFQPHNKSAGFTYTTNDFTKNYMYYDPMPEIIKERLSYTPTIIRILSQSPTFEPNSSHFKASNLR